MQGGAQPHALNALVLGFVLRLRQHRRQALGGSFRQGPWCSHAKPPASASLPLFMIVRKRISIRSLAQTANEPRLVPFGAFPIRPLRCRIERKTHFTRTTDPHPYRDSL